MIKLRRLEGVEEAPYLKKARGYVKLHKLEPLDIFHKLPELPLSEIKALKDKHWITIVTRLTEFLKTGHFKNTRNNNLEGVICKVFKALDGRFSNISNVNSFIEQVKKTGVFNTNEPISQTLQSLAEELFKPDNLIVLRLAELGRMYNLIGLIQAAISFNDDQFNLLLHRGINFSFPTFIPFHLAKCVLLNLRYESILRLLNLPIALPPESYHLVILNERLKVEQRFILVTTLLEKGIATDLFHDGVEPIQLAFEQNLPLISHLLASRPFRQENAKKYFDLAVEHNHADAAEVLAGQTVLVFDYNLPSSEARVLRNSLDTLMKLKGRMKWSVQPDGQILRRIASRTFPSYQRSNLAHIGALELHKGSLAITQATDDLIREMVKCNPQSLVLSHYQSLNDSLYYLLLFKRICHVWSLKINIEHPTYNGLIKGEGSNPHAMISFYIQFLELIQSEIPRQELAFALEHLKNFYSRTKELPVLLTIQKSAETSPQVLVSGYDIHMNIVILFKNFVIYCDRGGISEQKGFRVYQIPEDQICETKDIEAILSADQTSRTTCFSEKKLVSKLNLALLADCRLKNQKAGNCTHASVDAAIASLMTLFFKIKNPLIDWSAAYRIILPTYKRITQGYRYYMAQELVDGYNNYKKSGIKVKKVDDYFYKLMITLFLRLKESPYKLAYYTSQGPQLTNRLAQILNEF